MKELMIFEGNNVEIIADEKGNPLFELYSTGKALGYVTISKEKRYPHKTRINKTLENTDIEPVVHGVQQYLTEPILYDFMLEARIEKCKSFRKWVTEEVIPKILKTGIYILVTAEDSDEIIMAKALLIAQRTLELNKEK